jgi:hypothetical protein
MLSTVPITAVPRPSRTMPFTTCPVSSNTIEAGTHTIAVPTKGTSEKTAVAIPQSTGESIPKAQKLKPAREP